MTKKTYECTMDAQEGVVTFLLEEMAQQMVKENLLAYAILLQQGARLPMCMAACMRRQRRAPAGRAMG